MTEHGKEPVVLRWKLRDGRSGKTVRMSRAEAEVLVRELRRRFGRMSFEIG
jgi:hypothetical protein